MYKHSGWHYTRHWRNGKSITSDVNWLIDWLPSNLFCFRPERCGIHILHAPSRLASPVLLQGRLGLNNILILIFLLLTSYRNSWRHLDTMTLGRPILLSFTPEMRKTIHVPPIRGGSQGCPVSSKCELRPCRFSTWCLEDVSHHGLLDLRARGVTVFYIPWRQILGDFCGFRFGFRLEFLDVLALLRKNQHGFSCQKGLEDQCFHKKKVPSKRELRQWYTLKEAKKIMRPSIYHGNFLATWHPPVEGGNYTASITPVAVGVFSMHVLVDGWDPKNPLEKTWMRSQQISWFWWMNIHRFQRTFCLNELGNTSTSSCWDVQFMRNCSHVAPLMYTGHCPKIVSWF